MNNKLNNKRKMLRQIDELKQNITNNTAQHIIQAVEEAMGIPYEVMCLKTRKREIVQARQMCWYYMWHYCQPEMTLVQMGMQFSPATFDHSSCLHGRDTIADLIHVDKRMRAFAADVDTRIQELERGDIYFDSSSSSGLNLAQYMEFDTVNVRQARLQMLV